ncbi:MAG: replicative DNA helicase [Rhodospirillales bacterium]
MEPSRTDNVTPLRGIDGPTTPRLPPRNLEAEQALLGAILMNNRAHERVSEFLRPEHFSDPANGKIYQAMTVLIDNRQIADVVTLKQLFERDEGLSQIGGVGYLARLAGSVVTVVNAEDYGRTIHDAYLRRELIDLGEQVVNRAHGADMELPAIDQIEQAEQQLYDLATTGETRGGFRPLNDAVKEAIVAAESAFKRAGHVVGVTTGFRDLDAKLGGLHPSDLIVLAGRPAMGKSSLATNIAYNAARARIDHGDGEGAVVGFFQLEMSAEQIATRLISERAEVASDRIRRGDIRNEDFARIVEASQELHRLPLYIDDSPALSVSALRTRARRLQRQRNLGLIVIDYLQLVSPTRGRINDNRVQEISEITRGLKTLAKELHVPVLALSQLSRAVEQREDKRPQLADLRESGSIEQDADVVMFIYREEYYHQRAVPTQRPEESTEKFNDRMQRWQERGDQVHNKAEIIIGKQRHGPTGTVSLFFDGNFTKFGDLAPDARLPEQH